ncbi:MAG TPA: phosphotransferase [Candidatus Binataceae bacterium]|nr:phosphotransferase [Candidatus Binataceae bacterium]
MLHEGAAESNRHGDDLAERLLAHLGAAWQAPDLRYSAAPRRMTGGFETSVFTFAVEGAPAGLDAPMVLRVFSQRPELDRAALEATVQNTLAAMGYPVPRVWLFEAGAERLGAPFIVMELARGSTLVQEFAGLGSGRSPRELLRLLGRIPSVFGDLDRMALLQHRLHQLAPDTLVAKLRDQGLLDHVTFAGRFERMRRLGAQAGLVGLTPGIRWLEANQLAERSPVICHCDFQPFNVLSEKGRVSAVLDWGNVTIAAAELDVASTVANMSAVPLSVPAPLQLIFGPLLRLLARRYAHAYRKMSALDMYAIRYYQVFRCMMQLVWVADGVANSRPSRGIFDSAQGVARLVARIRSLSGVEVRFDWKRV